MRLGRGWRLRIMRQGLTRRGTAGGLLLLLASITLAAQASDRVLYVTVFERDTYAPVTGLGPTDVVIREDGAAREVLRVDPATSPMPIAVIVDNSAGASATIPDLRRALATFLRDLDGIGPIALITVADRPTVHQDYTTNQEALQAAAGRIFAGPQSGATLLDALIEVNRGLEKRESDRAAVVVVTTENVEYSTRHYRDVLEGLQASGAVMHAIVYTNGGRLGLDDAARNRASVLDLGPKESGGIRFDVLTSMSYEAKLQDIARILTSQQRVVYSRPPRLLPPETIEVAAAKPGLTASGAPARGQAGK